MSPNGQSSATTVARQEHGRLRTLALAGVLALAGPTLALEPSARASEPAAGDEALAAALRKFDAGRAALEAGQFEEALLDFQVSYALSPSPNSRLYIARCYRALGKVASAYTTFRFAAREAQDRLATTGEKRYGATREAANGEAAELEPRVPRLTLVVPSGTPERFSVKRNGVEVPQAAWGIAVETDPGPVVVEASGPRLVPFRRTIALAEGAQARIDVEVSRLPTATIALRFRTRPAGIEVTLDQTPMDVDGAAAPHDVDVGAHTMVVSAPGYVRLRWQSTLSNGEAALVDVELRPDMEAMSRPRGTPRWAVFAVGGAAVAALATGTVVAVHAKDQQDAELAKDPFSRDASTRDTIRSESTTANVFFVAGGVLAVGAAVLVFTTPWKLDATPDGRVGLAPWLGPGGGGLGARGRF